MKKKFLLLPLILSLVLLVGCGIELTSKLKLNTNFTGTRTMSCSIRISDLQSTFDGNADDLEKIIKDACPSSLSYTKKETNKTYTYTFYLNFTSKSDYKKKLDALLNFSPKLTYQYSSSPFVHGIRYEENFTSKDLMAWLFTAFYEKGYVDKEHSDDLWNLKKTSFYFDGNEYSTDNKISVNTLAYEKIDSIHVQTTQKENHTYKRTIDFNIPETTLEQHRSAIDSYFKNIKGTTLNWTSNDTGKTLHISFSADSFTDLCAITRKVLHSNISFGKSSLNEKKESPFSYQEAFDEQLDFTNFTDKSGNVSSIYSVTANQKTKELLQSTNAKPEVTFTCKNQIIVKSYDITSIYKNKENLQVIYQFQLADNYSKKELNKIISRFAGNTFSFVTSKKSKNSATIIFKQSGTVENCNADLKSVFSNCSIDYQSMNSIFKGKQSNLTFNFSLLGNNNKILGKFQLISISPEDTKSVSMNSKKYKKEQKSKNVIHKEFANYISANDTVQSIDSYSLSSDIFKADYIGNTTADHWIHILRFIFPLGILIILCLFIYKKQTLILEYIEKLKDIITKKME